jgi:hypothetical protein
MMVGVVVEHSASDAVERWEEEMALGGVKVAA